MATINQRNALATKYANGLAYRLSSGKYTVETWPSSFYRSLFEAMTMLPDRKRQVIAWRCNGDTLAVIGEQLGVTPERVRQIGVMAEHSMKKGYWNDVVLFGKEAADKIRAVLIEERHKALASDDILLVDFASSVQLSVRGFNVLYRAGCRTYADVLKAVESGAAEKFRNMGAKTYAELKEKLYLYNPKGESE